MYDAESSKKHTISVIVPVYNVAEYLSDCIQSILAQTYLMLEIILVDDGSTDNSGEICDLWQERDNRIIVIHQKNMGVSEARNTGIRAATGDYLGFVDADDWIEPEMYQMLLKSLIQNKADVSMCGYYDYPKGIDSPMAKATFPVPVSNYEEAIIPILRRNGYFVSMCNKLFCRNTVLCSEGEILLDSTIAYGEDEVWLFKVISRCRRISFIPKPLYHWRPREESVTRSTQITDRHMSLLNAKREVVELLPHDEKIQVLARGRMFNDCYILKVYAYLSDRMDYYRKVSKSIESEKHYWFRSNDIPFARKVKVIILDLLMRMKAPCYIIQKIHQTR